MSADVIVQDHGSVVLLHAATIKAQEWFAEHIPEDAQRWGKDQVAVEPRYVSDILEGMADAGLEIRL